MIRKPRGAMFVTVVAVAFAMGACKHEPWPGPKPEAAASAPAPPVSAAAAAERPAGAHPRILLTAERLAALSALARSNHPAWNLLMESCREAANERIPSGYESWDWAHAALGAALCFEVTKNETYAKAAITYFKALLDDGEKVGDGKGGDAIVHGDSGYGIRSHGFLGAIAYDWLHDAPGMTAELRKHAADRFVAWARWFGAEGYHNDKPISNYYAGYFGAVALGGIALDGDDPRASELRKSTRDLFAKGVVPEWKRLAGGDWPEGWQYGSLVGAVLAIYADAEDRKGGASGHATLEALPWLRDVVAMRAHALWPDGKHLFDNGDWGKKPATAPANELFALSVVLPAGDAASRRALFLAGLARDPKEDWRWLGALASDTAKKPEDPRTGPTSYLARGTGTMFARTDWSQGATWFALSSSPYLADHQHADAGHFEIVRGGDALLVDPGDYNSYATMSHNTILVDDGKTNLNYSPNQGSWGEDAKVTRFDDEGAFVAAQADFTSAYDPMGYPSDHPDRSVLRAQREIIFSRAPLAGGKRGDSARVVLYDRITLSKPTYGATWAAHGATAPRVSGRTLHIVSGRSGAWIASLLPASATVSLVREPSVKSDEAFLKNDPTEGTVSDRIEVTSPRGSIERRFLHAIAVGGSADAAPAFERIAGEGADGAAMDGEAYVFAVVSQSSAQPLSYRAPTSASHHVVLGLAPGARYGVSVTQDAGGTCRVAISAGGALVASPGGALSMAVRGCALSP